MGATRLKTIRMFYAIKNYERYGVSEQGIIKNLEAGKIIKLMPDKDGYLCFIACINYKKKCLKVHRVVGETFIPNPDNLPQINHKDLNKQNNHFTNLEWVTDLTNKRHLWDSGVMVPHSKGRYGNNAHRAIGVNQYCQSGNLIKEWGCIKVAAKETGVTNISACCKGKLKTAGGYIWVYKQ